MLGPGCGSTNPDGARFCLAYGSALSGSPAGSSTMAAGSRVARRRRSKGTYREKYVVTDHISGATKTHELEFKLE